MRTVQLLENLALPEVRGDIGDRISLPDEVAADMVSLGNAHYIDRIDWELKEVTVPDTVAMPRPYSPKADWVEYALSVDPELDEGSAKAMTKADLLSKYGERL